MRDRLVKARIFDTIAVASTGSATSLSLGVGYSSRVEAIILRAASVSGTADVKIEYATSHDDTNYDSFDDNLDVTSSSGTDKPNNKEGYNSYPMPAPLNSYIKIKVTGVGANPADTLVDCYLVLREES